MSPQASNNDIASLLRTRVIPCWESFGKSNLIVTANNLQTFQKQSLSHDVEVTYQERISKNPTLSSRRSFNNTSTFIKSWRADDQAIYRYPALVYVINGRADFHIADYILRCPPRHFLLFSQKAPRPIGRHPHLFGKDKEHRQCAVLCFFAPPGTDSVIAYICHSQKDRHWSEPYHIVHQMEVLQLYRILIQEIENDGKYIDLCFRSFLYFLLRELRQGHFYRTGGVNEIRNVGDTSSFITAAKQYISTHLNQSLTAEKIARQVFMSRSNFLRYWRAETSETLNGYIVRRRMEEAGRLLRSGNWSISHICRFVGMRPTQFRAQFKKYFGMTPSQFRCHHQSTKNKDETVDG